MNEVFGGWETGSVLAEGFDDAGAGVISTINPSKDAAGNGGNYMLDGSLITDNPTRMKYQKVHRDLAEGWIRAKVSANSTTSPRGFVISWYDGSTELGSIRGDVNQQLHFYLGTATLTASSIAPAFPINQYFTLDIHVRISDSVGIVDVFIDDDGTYTTPILSFSGDTKPGAETTFNREGYGMSDDMQLDEYGTNSISLRYDNGVGGVPAAGETITDGVSGATAVITSVEGDAVSGTLILQQWNGTAFGDGNALTSSGTMNAQVNAPNASFVNGFEPNSAALGEGFVVALVPTAPGNTTGLTSSTGGANWQDVNEIPVSIVDYVFGLTNGLYDTYTMSDLPSSALTVLRAGTYNYAAKDGASINNFAGVVRTGGVDYFGDTEPLGTTYSAFLQVWNVNPNTDADWSVAEINGAEAGPQVLT